MVFENLSAYLRQCRQSGYVAAVPIPLVAEHLHVTPAAVSAMVRAGRLKGLQIGRSSLISASSLVEYEAIRLQQVSKVEEYLWSQARAGTTSVFYDEVMAIIGLSTKIPAHRKRIGEILGDISRNSMKECKVLLSVLVHRKSLGTTRPGSGFFDLAGEYRDLAEGDYDGFVQRETTKVLKRASKRNH